MTILARQEEVGATVEAAATGIEVAGAEAAVGDRVVHRAVGTPGDRGNAGRVGPVAREEPVDARLGVTGVRAQTAGHAVTAGRARAHVIFAGGATTAGVAVVAETAADRATARTAVASAEAPCPRKSSRRLTA